MEYMYSVIPVFYYSRKSIVVFIRLEREMRECMNTFNKKRKGSIVIMVVLAMLFQMVGPVAQNVYAEINDSAFRVVDERLEDGIAYIDWEFTLDMDSKVDSITYSSNFTLEDPVEKELIADGEDGTVIGTYSISTEGKVTVKINQELYKEEAPVDLEDAGKTGEPIEPTDIPDFVGDEEEQNGTEGEDGHEDSMLGKLLTNLVYAGDDLPLVDFDIEENKVKTFKGTIEVNGARENIGLFMKLMGLFSTEKDLGNIFTDVKLIINGVVVANDDNTIVNLDELDESITIGLEFGWSLPNDGDGGFKLNKNDWGSIQLPSVFKGVTGYMNGPLVDGSRIVGTYEISTDGILKVIFGNHASFDEGFLTETERKGTVGFILDFVLDPFNENSIQKIEFGSPINKTFTIKVKPSGALASISKSGGPNKVPNADAIDWIIDVNTSLESLTNAIIKDSIPEGLDLEGNIEVYHLKVGINGSLTQGDLKDAITSTDPRNLELTLGKIDTAYL